MAKVKAEAGAQKEALNESGWLGEDAVAVGQLRQGKAPSMTAMVTGAALVEVLRPRRSKLLPRHFVLAVTGDRVVAFKASGGSPDKDPGAPYEISIRSGEQGSWPREAVRIVDLEDGDQSKGGTLVIAADDGEERVPVARPNLSGDPQTDELLALLAS